MLLISTTFSNLSNKQTTSRKKTPVIYNVKEWNYVPLLPWEEIGFLHNCQFFPTMNRACKSLLKAKPIVEEWEVIRMALLSCVPHCSCTWKVKDEFREMLTVIGPFWTEAGRSAVSTTDGSPSFLILICAGMQTSLYPGRWEALNASSYCSPTACIDNSSSAVKFDKHKILKRSSLGSPEIVSDLSFDSKWRKSVAVCILQVH